MELCTNREEEEKKSLDIYLCWMDYTNTNFTVTFTRTIGGKIRSFIKRTQDVPEKAMGHGWTFISHDDLFSESQNLIVDGVLTLEFEVTIIDERSSTFIKTNSF